MQVSYGSKPLEQPAAGSTMLRVLYAASGTEALSLDASEWGDRSVRALKMLLAQRLGCARFQLRIHSEDSELKDETTLTLPVVLQLTRLSYVAPEEARDARFGRACALGELAEVEEGLRMLQDPNQRVPDLLGALELWTCGHLERMHQYHQ